MVGIEGGETGSAYAIRSLRISSLVSSGFGETGDFSAGTEFFFCTVPPEDVDVVSDVKVGVVGLIGGVVDVDTWTVGISVVVGC